MKSEVLQLIENIQSRSKGYTILFRLDLDQFIDLIINEYTWVIRDYRYGDIAKGYKLDQLLSYPDIILKLEEYIIINL